MQAGLRSKYWGISGAFEWALCYFYPGLLLILAVDLCKTKSSDYKRNKVDQDDDYDDESDVSELEKGRVVQSEFGLSGQVPLDTSLYGAAHFRSHENTNPFNNYNYNNNNNNNNNTYSNLNNNNGSSKHTNSNTYTNTTSSTYVNSNPNSPPYYYTEKKLKMDSSSLSFESDNATLTADEASDYYPNRTAFTLPLSQLPPAKLDRELNEQQSIYKIIDSYR
ncbi:unnamed protein product [Ambrosiozyma monospora]|uniref:Unnamed protein product n=1 Tax=Ambrosiozyma monospora TaxID=43982 RepID=A0ACB5UAV1_AMBMO|nr:unnamed protein product [Ambrosiozyma monospora]